MAEFEIILATIAGKKPRCGRCRYGKKKKKLKFMLSYIFEGVEFDGC